MNILKIHYMLNNLVWESLTEEMENLPAYFPTKADMVLLVLRRMGTKAYKQEDISNIESKIKFK